MSGRGRVLHHDAAAAGGLPPWAALGLFLLAWQLMIVAMMLPSSLPLVRLFGRASANQPRPLRAKAAFLGGYAAVWTGFGAAAFLADLGVHRLVERWAWLTARPAPLGGAVLLLAGAFQFSRLKESCLTVCRHPAGYLLQHYQGGAAAAFRLGAGHGVFCVGCCWALSSPCWSAAPWPPDGGRRRLARRRLDPAALGQGARLGPDKPGRAAGRRGQVTIEGVGLTLAVTGGTGEFAKARGQMHETFLPSGEFRFAFTLHR